MSLHLWAGFFFSNFRRLPCRFEMPQHHLNDKTKWLIHIHNKFVGRRVRRGRRWGTDKFTWASNGITIDMEIRANSSASTYQINIITYMEYRSGWCFVWDMAGQRYKEENRSGWFAWFDYAYMLDAPTTHFQVTFTVSRSIRRNPKRLTEMFYTYVELFCFWRSARYFSFRCRHALA